MIYVTTQKKKKVFPEHNEKALNEVDKTLF